MNMATEKKKKKQQCYIVVRLTIEARFPEGNSSADTNNK